MLEMRQVRRPIPEAERTGKSQDRGQLRSYRRSILIAAQTSNSPLSPPTMRPYSGTALLPSVTSAHSLGAFKFKPSHPPRFDRAEIASHAEERLSLVEATIQRVYDFACSSAQDLSHTCGRDPDYYLRVIFKHGYLLHPTPESEPLSACQFTPCEFSRLLIAQYVHILADSLVEDTIDVIPGQAQFWQ